jgi:hypothetical protein
VRAVLNETLRLFPPVPLNVRESRSEPVAIPVSPTHTPARDLREVDTRPLYMPPNTVVMYFPILIHRDPSLWGADADAFDPDRWIDPARLGRFTRNPIMFTPFSYVHGFSLFLLPLFVPFLHPPFSSPGPVATLIPFFNRSISVISSRFRLFFFRRLSIPI